MNRISCREPFIFLFTFILISACHQTIHEAHEHSSSDQDKDTISYIIKSVRSFLPDSSAKDSTELVRSIITWPEFSNTIPSQLLDSLNQCLQIYAFNHFGSAKEASENFTESTRKKEKLHRNTSYKGWASLVQADVVLNTRTLVSLRFNSYGFTGGAHGNPSVQFVTLERSSSRQLYLQDIVENNRLVDLERINSDALRSERHIQPGQSFKEAGLFVHGNQLPLPHNFLLTPRGLLMSYNYYEIASYTQGIINYTIPFAALKGIIKQKYVII